ncbi:MAG: alpha/beta hydrolase [Cyanobacteria bacterium]|nr:alpha/beta hydrolase [Cyanobacteria bacterium CG_2015-16_32_12]NCO79124.1 alpha/beta hydrolase [Cyanobacteria bacterium CG_2015-22_32_23]NCQ05233.1 alpha/beta hydrolase [Cyanobacteria bacterium CG_2015-09_32_10]NCQ42464.1 alpha/beta hydrolase [Cyanobacteria bacterium CG_2015-04_32_10]NCS86020.1 alpha/beta hydrolase [Cyanobacteria bacterium CG_2015-02_32_10]
MFSLTRYCLFLSIFLTFVLIPFSKAIAAEEIILKYSMLHQSIPVEDLTVFCETGETSSALSYFLRLANQKPENVKNTLCRKIPVNGVMLSKILNNPFGEFILDGFAQVITTPTQKASRESLRGAVVTSALKDNNLSIMEVAQNYPTTEVHLNGDRLMEIYKKMEGILGSLPF